MGCDREWRKQEAWESGCRLFLCVQLSVQWPLFLPPRACYEQGCVGDCGLSRAFPASVLGDRVFAGGPTHGRLGRRFSRGRNGPHQADRSSDLRVRCKRVLGSPGELQMGRGLEPRPVCGGLGFSLGGPTGEGAGRPKALEGRVVCRDWTFAGGPDSGVEARTATALAFTNGPEF